MNTDIAHMISERTGRRSEAEPLIFTLTDNSGKETLRDLLADEHVSVIDDYEEQLREYFGIMNPSLVFAPDYEKKFLSFRADREAEAPLVEQGNWVFYPWRATLVHVLSEDAFYAVRTARNRNLITADEQAAYGNAVVGIAGLSVGSSVALALALTGGARQMRLADMDTLALSNLNRIPTGVPNLGLPKVVMAARAIREINPYATLTLFPEGITRENVKRFVAGPPRLSVIVDELDNLAVKHLLREMAREFALPVVMAADNGDNGVVDIERYDLNPNTPFFHGRIGETSYDALVSLEKREIGRTIARHVGPENTAVRMQESLPEVGKTLVSWPQLGGAALLNGVAVAYCIRRIAVGAPLEENRALVSLDEKLDPTYLSPQSVMERKRKTELFRAQLGLPQT